MGKQKFKNLMLQSIKRTIFEKNYLIIIIKYVDTFFVGFWKSTINPKVIMIKPDTAQDSRDIVPLKGRSPEILSLN